MGSHHCHDKEGEDRLQCQEKERKHTGSFLDRSQLIWVFNGLLGAGIIQLVIIFLAALLFRRVRRIASWYMFILSWIILSIAFLFLAGQQATTPPSPGVCLAQAALIYASPPLTAYATLILILQLHVTICSELSQEHIRLTTEYIHILLMLPPMIFFLVIFEVFTLALQNPEDVCRDYTGMICHLESDIAATVNTVIIGLGTLGVIYLEACTLHVLLRRKRALKQFPEYDTIDHGIIVRLILFNIAPFLVLVYEVVNIPLADRKIPITFCHIAYASLPNIAAWLFGSQKDMVRVWMYWKKDILPKAGHKQV